MNKNLTWVILLFLITGIISWNQYFRLNLQKDSIDVHSFPMRIGDWSAKELTIPKEDLEILETKNAFVREYTKSNGKKVYLYVVYAKNNRKVSHPPEICYTGSGIDVVENTLASIPFDGERKSINANRLVLKKGKARQIAYYWFKIGHTFTSNYWKQQALFALKSLVGQPLSSALIRVSCDVKTDDLTSDKTIQEFSALVLPLLNKILQ